MFFTKYHGLGNDFILIEDFEKVLLPQGETLAKSLCHRRFGIGADGLVLITVDSLLYTMRIFNADGAEAEMCGNAIRCVAAHLLERKLVSGPVLEIGTISGVKPIRVRNGIYAVDMGKPDFSFNKGQPLEIKIEGKSWEVHPVSMGNPHGVVFLENLDALDIFTWGPLLENNSVWPQKANIGFGQVLSTNHLHLKVWERGAGATLACGSGACAAAAVAGKLGLTEGNVTVSLPGGDLLIERRGRSVIMVGPAIKVFSGQISELKPRREKR